MAVIHVSGVPAGTPSTVVLPLTGRAWADVTLASTAVPWATGDQVEVGVQDGPTLRMTVERLGPRGGFLRARLVGGTGGLSRDIPARFYRDIPAATVAREILQDCGEAAGGINLPGTLPTWVRPAGPAHEALRSLMMRYPERLWQMAPDGKVHIGAPDWSEAKDSVPVESEDAATGTFTVAFSPTLVPGLRVGLRRGEEVVFKRVARISHVMEEVYSYPRNDVRLRTLVGTGDGTDQGVDGLEQSVQRALRWVDYLALYEATVIRDHGDHTLDLRPAHPLLPELVRVRLVQPMPGTRIKLKAGGTVLLSFQRGDPSRPVALHHGLCELELLEIVTGRGQMLRVDDDRGNVSPEDARYQRPHIRVQDAAGQSMELWAAPGQEYIQCTDRAGQRVRLDPVAQSITIHATTTVTIQAAATVTVQAPLVNVNGSQVVLAGGGPAVGRVGDQVQVVGVMPGPGTATGTIISGSPKVTSG